MSLLPAALASTCELLHEAELEPVPAPWSGLSLERRDLHKPAPASVQDQRRLPPGAGQCHVQEHPLMHRFLDIPQGLVAPDDDDVIELKAICTVQGGHLNALGGDLPSMFGQRPGVAEFAAAC